MKVIIYDNQFIFREGLKTILTELKGYSLAAETDNLNSLLELLNKHKPDILICDLFAEETPGIYDPEIFRKITPNTKILVITNETRDESILNAIAIHNVFGYYFKNCRKVDIITALTVIANNGKSFDHKAIDSIHSSLTKKHILKKPENNLKKLTKRETEIVKHITEGKTAKLIAEKMHLSIHTVNTYKKNILKKLKVKNSSELVMHAIKNKIIDPTEYYI